MPGAAQSVGPWRSGAGRQPSPSGGAVEGVAVGVRVGCGDGLWPLDRVGLGDGFAVGDGFGEDVAVGDDVAARDGFAVADDFTSADVRSTVFAPAVVARLGIPCRRAVPAVREVRARGATCVCATAAPGLGRRGCGSSAGRVGPPTSVLMSRAT
ncbi:hypothetical protein BIV25_21690 [Streptomyces sp. MUSC 14]|nr:hypothetical protein BIV25_21690 [Streptomyces sp. MUSC 14]